MMRPHFHRSCAAIAAMLVAAGLFLAPRPALARLDTERYGKLREAERYQMDIAEKLFDDRQWESALSEYEKFITLYQTSPGAPYAQYLIAVCQEQRKFTNQAIREYKALIAYFPDSPEAPLSAFAIGRCLAACGEPELAVQQYLEVVEKFPKHMVSGNALWDASEIQLTRDLYDKALAVRIRLVENYPKCDRFAYAADWLVDHYLFKADDLAAARKASLLRRNAVDAERFLADRCWGRGYDLWYHGNKDAPRVMDKAIAIYEGIRTQFADNKDQVRDSIGMIAQCYRYSARPEKATEAFERLLAAFPEADNWRAVYADHLEKLAKWTAARTQFALLKDKAKSAYETANSYNREHKIAEAEAAYMRVVADYPAYAQVSLYQIGDMHQHISGNYEKAINAYRQSEYSAPAPQFRIAECFIAMKKHDMAIKTYQEIVGFFPDHAAEATWRMGLCYEARGAAGDDVKAVATFKRVCDVYPQSTQSSAAHQRLEDKYHIPYTGGGVKK